MWMSTRVTLEDRGLSLTRAGPEDSVRRRGWRVASFRLAFARSGRARPRDPRHVRIRERLAPSRAGRAQATAGPVAEARRGVGRAVSGDPPRPGAPPQRD